MSRSHVRTTAVAASAVVAAVAGVTGAVPVHAHTTQHSDGKDVGYFAYQPLAKQNRMVGFLSDRPLSENVVTPVSGLPSSARELLAGRSAVTPQTDTPRGYKLRKGNTPTNYIYKSADVYAIEADCDSDGCRPVQQVKLAIKEYVRGRTSKNWEITFYASRYSGPSHFHMEYYYECGVNIPNAKDKTCSTWKRDGAQGHAGPATAVNKQYIVKNFGKTPVVTKFPMINLLVTFNDGSEAIGDDGKPGEKFRGWDVCVTKTTTKLCHSTGDGS
ncbi:hypothetical protein [Streptomyces sasae]|uniref:hypothetical protein n=1 Tax=Streptomyces sasae TaxID=1266772 RepID=UPI002931D655|nr:hypothetical protein [Streptomyces sasae]